MKLLESTYKVEDDPYGSVSLMDLIGNTNEKEENLVGQSTSTSSSESAEYSPLNIRIEAIKVYLTTILLNM
jgi:hypothetical protein